jgi:hypothetical protein
MMFPSCHNRIHKIIQVQNIDWKDTFGLLTTIIIHIRHHEKSHAVNDQYCYKASFLLHILSV